MKTTIEPRRLGRFRYFAIILDGVFLCQFPRRRDAKDAQFRADGCLAMCANANMARDRAIQYARTAALDYS